MSSRLPPAWDRPTDGAHAAHQRTNGDTSLMNIVLIPGFMTDATLWDDVLPDLRNLQSLGTVVFGDPNEAATVEEMARHILA